MNFVSPDRLVWLAAAIPIIGFYILRSRLRKAPVSTLLFWDELFDQKRQRSWWQRLRHWLSLLLQLAFVGLVVFSLLDPLWSGQNQDARQVVLVLDNSASMSATDDGDTNRFTRAVEAARGVVRELRDGDEIALVTAGSTVRVVVGITDFGPAVRDALATVELTDGPTRISEAIEAARRMTRTPERRQVVVISDGGFDEFEELTAAEDVRWIPIGEPADNVAITQLAVRRSLVDPIGYAVLLEVTNFADGPAECRLSIDLQNESGDELVDVVPLRLAAGQVWQQTIVQASAQGGTLVATIDSDDGLAVDNVARAVVPGRMRIPVTLVTESPSLYLESVLGAIPLVDLTVTTDVPARSPAGGFTVLHRIDAATLPGGAVLAIDPIGDSDRWTLGDPIAQSIIAEQNTDSPLMPHVRLQNVAFPGARGLQIASGGTNLLTEAGGGVLMASLVDGDDRVVVLSASLEEGDLPLRIAFPVMMTNAVNWFLSRTGEIEPAMRTGQLGKIAADSGDDESWNWTGPDGKTSLATHDSQTVLVGPVDRIGMVGLQSSRGETKKLAVNLADSSESDLRSRGQWKPDSQVSRGSGFRSIWFYLTCVALGLMVGEWFLYQRRVVG